MPFRAAFCLLLLCAHAVAQDVPPPVPAAARRYLDVLRKRPQPGTLFDRFYAAWLEEGTVAELQHYLQAGAQKAGAEAGDHLLLAIFQSHGGNDAAALTAYQAALKLDSSNPATWIECSRIEARMLDFTAALESLDKAAAAKPEAAQKLEITQLRGRALLRIGKSEEAVKLWKDLAAANADDDDLNEEIIDLFVDEGQFEAALESARAVVQRSRDPLAKIRRQLRLTDILQLAEQRDEALETLDAAFAGTGADTWIESDILARFDRLFRMSDDVSGLQQHLATLSKTHPQRVTLAWQHARLLAATGQTDAALQSARGLLQSNPGRRDLQEGFLDLLESLERTPEAVEQAKLIAAQNPGDKELIVRLAILQHRAGDAPAALITLETFLAAEGAGESAHLRVARILENWEEPPSKAESPAAKAYVRLVTTYPDSLSAQEAQAQYLHRNGRREEALAIWRRLAKAASLEDLLRIAQALQARQESRPALDVLLGREADFSTQPRFLALLVQQALANQEFERALPWARARLRLTPDADGIESALKDIRSIVHFENQKLVKPLIGELQKLPALSLQDRCLLAALLDLDGRNSEAEKLLTTAPPEHSLTALNQLSQIYQARMDWLKAARTLQGTLALAGGRTSSTLQRLVDLYRRGVQPEEALKYIAEWKTVSPSAVQPWLTEARVLEELFRPEASLKVLRQALRKFPDATDVATACATACLNVGEGAEAERIYLAIYEKTTDTASRLRQLSPLALAARSHDGLAKLVENFTQRQKQNRVSAYPWLALAEIHRATDNDEERRRCLYEASRLRPQDLSLLVEIARSEEEVGLTDEALRTLEAAAKLDKTTRTREHIARLQIENGDADAGYRMLSELAGSRAMDPREIEQIAAVIAARDEWKRVITFLGPLLEKHPKDYRLHYLHALALEEGGHEAAAVQAFMQVLGMHEELAVAPAPAPVRQRHQQSRVQAFTAQDLPPGTADWISLPGIAHTAYKYRSLRASAQQARGASVQTSLPSNVTVSPSYALVHVLQISSGWPAEEQKPLLRQLQREGVEHAPLLLELAQQSSDFSVNEDTLAAHPQDAALHAAWLLDHLGSDDPARRGTANLRCHEIFKDGYRVLAFQAAYGALLDAESEADAGAWVQRLIDLCEPLPRSLNGEWFTLADLLPSQDGTSSSTGTPIMTSLTPEQSKAVIVILHRWLLAMDSSELDNQRRLLGSLIGAHAWDGVIECLQHMIVTAGQPIAPGYRASPFQPNGFEPQPLPLSVTSIALPPFTATMLTELLEGIRSKSDDESSLIADFQAAMVPRIAGISDPPLKFMLTMLCGKSAALLTEVQPRLSSPAATADDFLTAGWICQEAGQHAAAIAHLQQAQKITTSNETRVLTVNAILFNAEALVKAQEEGAAEASAVIRSTLESALQLATTREEKESLARLMEKNDMETGAEKLRQTLPNASTPVMAQSTAAILNPYARALLQTRSGGGLDSLERLFMQNNPSGALNEARRRTRILTADWHKLFQQSPGQPAEMFRDLLSRLEARGLRQPLLLSIKTAAATGWQRRQDYAAMLAMQHAANVVFSNNDGDRTLSAEELLSHATAEYGAVLAANPQGHAARYCLVLLLARTDARAALQHWLALPAAQQPDVLDSLVSQRIYGNDPSVRAAEHARLVAQWLKNIDPAGSMPARCSSAIEQVLFQTQMRGLNYPGLWEIVSKENTSKRNQPEWEFDDAGMLLLSEDARRARHLQRLVHDELCHALAAVPALAGQGFAPLAGLAMLEGRQVEETEKLALQILSEQTRPQVRRQLKTQHPSTAQIADFNRGFQSSSHIALPDPSVFATWSAAQRGDVRLLEDVVLPAILKAEGQGVHDFCRGYSALIMSSDQEFSTAAARWLRPWARHANTFGPRGMAREIVRLWQARQISAPLDDLFVEHRNAILANTDPFRSDPQQTALDDYARALMHRGPEELPRLIRRMRDVLVSPDAALRRQALKTSLEKEKQGGPVRRSFADRGAAQYRNWLRQLVRNGRGCFTALEMAMEDGMADSVDWLEQMEADELKERLQTPEDFVRLSRALGFLHQGDGPSAFASARLKQQDLMASLATHFRDLQKDEVVQATLAQLGAAPSAGLAGHLLQAMLVRAGVATLSLDGQPVPLEVVDPTSSRDLSHAAFHLVLVRDAAAIAALPPEERQNLGNLLSRHLPAFPKIEIADETFMRAVAPILGAEADGLRQRADTLLACKTWEEFAHGHGEPESLIPFLLKFVSIDQTRSTAVAHHALKLMQSGKLERAAVAAGTSDTPSSRLIMALAQVPPLLGTSLTLAEEDGLSQSPGWCSKFSYLFDEALKNPDTTLCVFQDTPFTAEAGAFRDLRVDDPCEPTLLARIINNLEHERVTGEKISRWLARQPSTFGTRLLQAFLHRGSEDEAGLLSFYDEPRRPDDSRILDFIRRHGEDFARIAPQSAPPLLALFQARLPDLQSRIVADPALHASLQPLIKADARQLDLAVAAFLGIVNLKQARCGAFELMQHGQQLLDRLAPVNKARAVEVLDHVSKIMATEEILAQSRGKLQAPHLTGVAQWLQFAAVTPELFDDIMQRATECGAAANAGWMQRALIHVMDIHYLRNKPERFVPLLQAAHMLDPAATFNPWPIPQPTDHQTMLELWQPKLQQRSGVATVLTARQPRTFGADLLRLLCGTPTEEDVTGFAKSYAAEIAATTPAQQKILISFFQRQSWAKIILPLLPSAP